MTDFVEWNPKRHGQRPPYWTPDTLTGLDNKNYVRQPNWAWIAGTTYYVPYEAVHGRPRADAMDELFAQDADLIIAELLGDYQLGVLDERARCAALADSITDTYAGDECGRAIADAIRAALQETGQ